MNHHALRLTLYALLLIASPALAQSTDDKQATFFMGRVK